MKYHVKISNLSFDIDFESVGDIADPIVNPPIDIEPPVVTEMPSGIPENYIFLENFAGNELEKFYQALNQTGKILRLKDNTSYNFAGFKQVSDPTLLAIVGKDSVGWINKDDAEEMFLFTKDNPRFGTIGVHWLIKGDIEEKLVQPTKALFRTVRDKVKTGMLAMIGSQVPNDKTLGINLARYVYSGSDSDTDFLYVIGKDLKTNGADFMHLKAPNGGNLYSILENVEVHNPIVKFPQTHKYNPTTIKSSGFYDGITYEITSANTVDQVLTWHGYQNGNVRTIINIGRYVWNVDNDNVGSNSKIIYLGNTNFEESHHYEKISDNAFNSSAEFQAGDVITFGVIKSKQIDHGEFNWSYELESDGYISGDLVLIKSSINLPYEVEAEITYKGNSLISPHPISINSKFGDQAINQSNGYGWTAYNQKEITAFWKNVKLEGFYRQSTSGVGSSKGYCMINSIRPDEDVIINSKQFNSSNDYDENNYTPLGKIIAKVLNNTGNWLYSVKESIYETVFGIKGAEFNPQEPVTHSGDMPEEAKEFIEWLESLT